MIRCVCVEDEEYFRNKLIHLVNLYFRKKNLYCDIKSYSNPDLLLYDLNEAIYYDVYFLDIELKNSIDGFELANMIRFKHEKAIIIFITSHAELAIHGYDYQAFNYLLKDDLDLKINNVLKEVEEKLNNEDGKYYIINTNSRYEKLYYEDIIYVYKEAKNSVFVTRFGDSTYTRETIQNINAKLCDDMFIFINRSYIVNLLYINKLHCNDIILKNGDILSVSRSRAKSVKEILHEYWRIHII